MTPPSEEVENATPAQICALYDLGGGVALRNSFTIYSIVALSPNWSRIMLDTNVYGKLQAAANTVAALLPIFTCVGDAPFDLVSLPCPSRQRREINNLIHPWHEPPWFLINAATYSAHCIFGQGSRLESLLMVLQRPWCVLELCCCDTPTLAAVYKFAVVANEIDHVNYHPAAKLIAHEMNSRQTFDDESTRSCNALSLFRQESTLKPLSEAGLLYADLSRGCLRSYMSFWIGMITTCAVYLNVAFSDLALMLAKILCHRLSISGRELRETVIYNHRKIRSSEARLEFLGLQSSHSGFRKRPTAFHSDSDIDSRTTNSVGSGLYGVGQTALNDFPLDMKQLLELYAGILKGIGESII